MEWEDEVLVLSNDGITNANEIAKMIDGNDDINKIMLAIIDLADGERKCGYYGGVKAQKMGMRGW